MRRPYYRLPLPSLCGARTLNSPYFIDVISLESNVFDSQHSEVFFFELTDVFERKKQVVTFQVVKTVGRKMCGTYPVAHFSNKIFLSNRITVLNTFLYRCLNGGI